MITGMQNMVAGMQNMVGSQVSGMTASAATPVTTMHEALDKQRRLLDDSEQICQRLLSFLTRATGKNLPGKDALGATTQRVEPAGGAFPVLLALQQELGMNLSRAHEMLSELESLI